MSDENARIDYFRSELLGKLDKMRTEATEMEKRLNSKINQLQDTATAQARKIIELQQQCG